MNMDICKHIERLLPICKLPLADVHLCVLSVVEKANFLSQKKIVYSERFKT